MKLGFDAYYPFIISIIISLLVLTSRLLIVNKLLQLPIRDYFMNVILKIVLVCLFAPIIPLIMKGYGSSDLYNFLIVGFSSVICLLVTIYIVGIDNQDKEFVKNIIYKKLKNHN